ncbi:hypothetical protein MKW98_029125, partial [Papaver atlanticum]
MMEFLVLIACIVLGLGLWWSCSYSGGYGLQLKLQDRSSDLENGLQRAEQIALGGGEERICEKDLIQFAYLMSSEEDNLQIRIAKNSSFPGTWRVNSSKKISTQRISTHMGCLASTSSTSFSQDSVHALFVATSFRTQHPRRGTRFVVRANRDYYSVLGVSRSANKADIKS